MGASWQSHVESNWPEVLSRSLCYVCALSGGDLIGFVNVAWDGGSHAFLLDTTVHPDYRRKGIGRELVSRAAMAATEHAIEWIHVDYEPNYREFYQGCGFRPTDAGLMHLGDQRKKK